ncbi:MAG: ribulose-phosphate 3-epimerase [Bacteroidota bacterium]
MKHLVAPSMLAADWRNLTAEVEMINESEADWFHLDVMDGRFVPNISFGFFLIEQIKSIAQKPCDVHLMIEEPEKYIEQTRKAGADIITVHYEACRHLHSTLMQIKATGAMAGVAVNPHTSIKLLEDILEIADLVLVMSVNPGFGGQKFIYQTLPKVKQLKDMITVQNTSTLIEVDGGVGLQNAEKCLQAGVDVLVAGSSIFKAADSQKAIQMMKAMQKDRASFV